MADDSQRLAHLLSMAFGKGKPGQTADGTAPPEPLALALGAPVAPNLAAAPAGAPLRATAPRMLTHHSYRFSRCRGAAEEGATRFLAASRSNCQRRRARRRDSRGSGRAACRCCGTQYAAATNSCHHAPQVSCHLAWHLGLRPRRPAPAFPPRHWHLRQRRWTSTLARHCRRLHPFRSLPMRRRCLACCRAALIRCWRRRAAHLLLRA